MIKKNPTYRVTVTYYNEALQAYESKIIEYPITCKFNSTRNTFSNSNKCTIELYNLNSTTRTAIFKDSYVGDLDQKQWKFIKLEAGWNGILSQIFYGRILQAYSSKAGGQTDIITHIDCLPFDIFNSYSSYTFEAGTSYRDAYKTMVGDLKNCQFGNLGSLEGIFQTQTTFCGNTMDCINELTGGNTYVDNGVVNTIMSNEVLDIPVPLVTDNNGLLSTPIRRDATLTIKMLFEPTLSVGQLLEVNSSIQSVYNGQYKVLGFTHDCLISPTQTGQRITTVDLWIIPALTGSDISLTGNKVKQPVKVKNETLTPLIPTPIKPKWIKPCNGAILSPYGWRKSTNSFHTGIDIDAKVGTPVKAIADGKVTVAWGNISGYGNAVYIDHGMVNGVKVISEYGHLSHINTNVGKIVKQGQVIGLSGGEKGAPGSGISEGAHLHLTIREVVNGKMTSVPPSKYINW